MEIAEVIKLNYGSDGLVRAAELRTASGTTNRPIQKLYPLEVSTDDIHQELQPSNSQDDTDVVHQELQPANGQEVENDQPDCCDSIPPTRPQRKASIAARKCIRDVIKDL